MDAYGNVATNYAGHIHFTSTDSSASLPADSTLTGGTGIFHVTLQTAGSQRITAADTLATGPTLTGTSSAITTRGLVVTGTKVGGSSVEIDFSKPFDPSKITMYGSGLATVQDVTLVGATNGAITGTLYLDPSHMSATFKATEASLNSFFTTKALPDDQYTLTVVSGLTNGFNDSTAPLDGGNNAGTSNYTTTFTVANGTKPVLSLPDFARGPDGAHSINIPASTAGAGIPVTITNATGLTDAVFTLSYNPTLLNVTGATGGLTAGTPTMIDATHANVVLAYHNGTAQNGTVQLGSITANVPNSAGSQYKAKELLTLSNITVNGAAFTGVAASAIHVNAYLGDVTGNGTIDALDVATANNVATGSATGFSSYALLDPAIVGDPQGDISVDAGDVSAIAAVVAHLPEPTIPAIPSSVTITPLGADPTLSLSGDQASVSVLLDRPNPVGSTGMTEAILALSYDPKILSVSPSDITLGSIPSLGTGWQLTSVIDQMTGKIGITLYSTTAITATQAGSLVNIAFHMMPRAAVSTTSVQLVNRAMANGQQFTTQVDDAQGQFILSRGVDRLAVDTSVSQTSVDTVVEPIHVAAITSAKIVQLDPAGRVALVETATDAAANDSLAVISNGAVPGDTVSAVPANMMVSGALAFQTSAPTQTASQVIQIGSSPAVRTRLGVISQQLLDQLFQAIACYEDSPGQDSVWASLNLNQEWLDVPMGDANATFGAAHGKEAARQIRDHSILNAVFAQQTLDLDDFGD
jgi:hypothetical protein